MAAVALVAVGELVGELAEQVMYDPARQSRQRPQPTMWYTTTRSPRESRLPAGASTTSPHGSCPAMTSS